MNKQAYCRDIEILVIEDNAADTRLIREYFKDEKMIPHSIYIVPDGVEAFEFLNKNASYKNVPKPDIILLDLYMPRMNGSEFLEKIRKDKSFNDIVICIMTSSQGEAERLNIEQLPYTFYILKPVDTEKFLDLIEKALSYLPDDLKNILDQNNK